MPRKKKPETQEVKVPEFNQPRDVYRDMTDVVKSLLLDGSGEETKISLHNKEVSIIDFVMYVESIAQKARRYLDPVEAEILAMFLDIMRKHAVVVGQELYSAYSKMKEGGKL